MIALPRSGCQKVRKVGFGELADCIDSLTHNGHDLELCANSRWELAIRR